jgi:hypothetical protein
MNAGEPGPLRDGRDADRGCMRQEPSTPSLNARDADSARDLRFRRWASR